MKKHNKSPGLVPNKSMEIRRIASELVSEGKPPRPKEIIARIKKKGIQVTSQQVSMALSKTEFAYRRNQILPPTILPNPAQALGQVSLEDVLKAKKFVDEMGTIQKAAASIVALGQFGYTPQPPQREENKDIKQNKTFIAETQAAEQHRG